MPIRIIVFPSLRRPRQVIHAVLDEIPQGYQGVEVGGVLVVVGPTGAFALTTDDPDAATAARRVANAAARTRNTLCAELSWAPFVDALVVTDRATVHADGATVVPTRLLRDVLASGHVQLDANDIVRIVGTLEATYA